jgi:folate-binding protein YgfZ
MNSPLHEATAAAGAVMAEYGPWTLPAHFGDVGAEYRAAREGVALFDLSLRSKVEVRGEDRAAFVNNFVTNNVVALGVGQSCEAFLLTGQAKIVARLRAHSLEDRLWLDADPLLAGKIIGHLERFVITERVEFVDQTEPYGLIRLRGPRAQEIVAILRGGEAAPGLVVLSHARVDVVDLVMPGAGAPGVWRRLLNGGATPAGQEAYEVLRLEDGEPEYGRDMDETNLPQELGRDEQAISFTKGCYLGQETVARIKAYGHVNRRLVGLRLDGTEPAPPGTRVLRDGQEVGRVTSSDVSPCLGCAIALATLRRGHEGPGTRVELGTSPKVLTGEVVQLPFVP